MGIFPSADASLTERLGALVVPLLILWVAYQLSLAAYYLVFHPLAGIPGPFLARSSKLWLLSKIFTFQRCWAIHDLFKEYKSDIVRIAPNVIAFQDSGAMQKLYGKTAVKPPYYKGFQIGGFDHCMSVEPYEEHATRRKLINPVYSPQQLMAFQPELLEFGQAVIHRIRNDGDEGKKSVDLSELTKQLQFDVVALIGLGKRFDIVRDHPEHWLTKVVHGVTIQLGMRTNLPKSAVRVIESLPVPAVQEIVAAQPEFNKYTAGLFEAARKDIAESGPDDFGRETVITRMLRGKNEKDEPLDGEICAEVSAHLIAGTDTTSVTAGYMFYELAKKPWIQEKVYEEIKNTTDDSDVLPTIPVINGLPYVNWVVKEALRVYAPTPGSLPRVVPPGGAFVCGRYIPAGVEVCAQGWTSHRVKSVWGPDADEFRPERWEKETEDMRQHHMPYGLAGSPRSCPGHHLASFDLKMLLVAVVRNFEIKADEAYTNDKSVAMFETFAIAPVGKAFRFFCSPREAAKA